MITHAPSPFGRHSMVGVCQMVIESFWSPKRKGGGSCNIIFEKKIIPPKKFQSPSDGGVCWMVTRFFPSPSTTPPLSDSDWIFLVARKGGVSYFLESLRHYGDQKFLVVTRLATEIHFGSPFITRVAQMSMKSLLCPSWQTWQTHQNGCWHDVWCKMATSH